MTLPGWLESYIPAPTTLSNRQRAVIVAGALVGIGLTALLCGFIRLELTLKLWMMAPLGATAVQIFSVPGSPMSQPWPVIAGHALSALAGLIAYYLFGATSLGAAIAVAMATGLMLQCRALHPSGGGTALFVILSKTGDWAFIAFPVIVNAAILVFSAIAWHRLTGRSYPQNQRVATQPHTLALHRFEPADLEAAVSGYGETLDISRADVEVLIQRTEVAAFKRMAAGLTCAQIMTRKVHTISAGLNVRTAERLMLRNDVNALPVTDRDNNVLGLLKIEAAREAGPGQTSAEVMMRDYFHRHADTPAAELVELFSHSDRRYVVILDDGDRLAGIVAKSDLMRALFHASA